MKIEAMPSILAQVEHIATARPDALAVVDRWNRLTYRELILRSRGVASQLIRAGVSPEGRVGIYLDRSVDVIAALLGCWMVRAAYVALDVEQPVEYVERIACDAKLSGVIVSVSREASWLSRWLPTIA